LNLKGAGSDISEQLSDSGTNAGRAPVSSLSGETVPLLRYFTVVGLALLALLFVASCYFPETETTNRTDVARPVIRIASNRVAPPRVDIDTRVQDAVIPAAVPEVVHQSPAQVAEARPAAALPKTEVAVKIERSRTKIPKRIDHQRMAANPQEHQLFRSSWWPL